MWTVPVLPSFQPNPAAANFNLPLVYYKSTNEFQCTNIDIDKEIWVEIGIEAEVEVEVEVDIISFNINNTKNEITLETPFSEV